MRAAPTSPCGQAPACRVANRLRRDLGISRLEELHWLHVGIIEVEWSADSDEADVVVKGRGVPAPVELHLGDGPGLVIALQVPSTSLYYISLSLGFGNIDDRQST